MSDSANNAIGAPSSDGSLPPVKPGEQRFTWNFDHKMDGQKRVQFPAVWRPQGEASEARYTLVLWPHPHVQPEKEFAFIMGLTPKQFEAMLAKMEANGLGNRSVAALRRKIFHNSFELSLDPAGRLCLPPKMAAQVGLDKDVHFVGAGGHFEIWEPSLFEKCTKADDNLAAEAYETLV
jgi:division/cell wall cluster transcriptional repressor MraZ